MKNELFTALAFAGLLGMAACTTEEPETEVLEEPAVEAPAVETPATVAPMDAPAADRPFDPALDVNNNGILDADEGLGDADNDGILDRDEEYVPPTS